jgi:flagellar biosynthetic protein FliR
MTRGSWPFFELVMRAFGDLMRVAVAISAPVMIAAFLTDLALGMINRVASQIQIFFISQQIKPGVTVLIVFTAMHAIMERFAKEFAGMFLILRRALVLLG